MTARLLHVSDLHAGTREEEQVEPALARLVERIEPQLVVASGDLAHRGRRAQHERAAALLRSLGPPVLAVPGNHDIPGTPARLLRPWLEFERVWETTEPTASAPGLHVVGLNSVRPFRYQGGALSRAQLRGAAERLAAAEEGALRVAVLHHHLLGAPLRAAQKRPLSHRNRVLHALVEAGADLILAGHIHQSAVSERHEFEVVGDESRTAVVAVAPGLAEPSRPRLAEARRDGDHRGARAARRRGERRPDRRAHLRLVGRRLDARRGARVPPALDGCRARLSDAEAVSSPPP